MKVLLSLFALLLLASCSQHQEVAPPTKGTALPPSQAVVLGDFVGVLPCADCAGIDTRLVLVQDDLYTAEGTYTLSETREVKGAQPVLTSGAWTTLRGSAEDPDDTVYQLDPDKPATARLFLRVNNDTIEPLDRDGRRIAGAASLRRAEENTGLANPASVNCGKLGGASEILADANGGAYGICRFPDGRECEEWALFRDGKCVPH